MLARFTAFVVALSMGAVTPPVAAAYPPDTCSDTSRTNIPAGDPDYATWLDRDGDGIACESDAPGYYSPAPLLGGHPRTFTTYIVWLDVDCIMVRFPNGAVMEEQSICDSDPAFSRNLRSRGNWIDHTASSGQLIGADPVMGGASSMQCTVKDDATDVELMEVYASAGDGNDVNCLMPAP